MAPHARAQQAANRLVEMAQEVAGKGGAAASRQLVDRALALDPDNPRARRELAMHLLARGDVSAAAEELRRVAAADPRNGGAARELAAVLYQRKDVPGAIHWLREAVKREPDSGLNYVGLAHCLLEMGNATGALRAAERAVALWPRYQPAQAVLGRARWRQGDLAGAHKAFADATELRPSDVSTLLAAAGVASELGHQRAALGYARRAVSAGPNEGLAWLVLSQVLRANGRGAEARRALSRAQALRSSGARPGRAEGRGHGGGRQ
jgi:tetratricopeptide (TPR) repeat protein